jgi:hypothetical protein
MKKRAIIIATPNCPKHTKLPGATKDAETWEAFLHSPEGGAWKAEEVEVFSDPTKDLVDMVLNNRRSLSLDYALLAFSGHGYYTKPTSYSTETRMLLSDAANDYITENTFSIRAKRELVIMDACREYGGELLLEKIANMIRAMEASAANEDRFRRAREVFDSALAAAPEGRSLVYSCDLNQTADDVSSFTRFLISDGTRLAKEAKTICTVSIKEAFDAAEGKPAEVNYPQKPIYAAQRRLTHLPFSVSI